MSERCFRNCIAALLVFVVLSLLVVVGHTFVGNVAKFAIKEAAKTAAKRTLTAQQMGQLAAGMATMNTLRTMGTNGQILRFAFSTGMTGGALTALTVVAAQRIGYQLQNVDDDGNPIPDGQGEGGFVSTFCTDGTIITPPRLVKSDHLDWPEGVAAICDRGNWQGARASTHMSYKNALGGQDWIIFRYESAGLRTEKITDDPSHGSRTYLQAPVSGNLTWAGEQDLDGGHVFDPELPSNYFDVYGNPMSVADADRIAEEIARMPWPSDTSVNRFYIESPTDSEVQTQYQTLIDDLSNDDNTAYVAADSGTIIHVSPEVDDQGLRDVWYQSDKGSGKYFIEKVTNQVVEDLLAKINEENTEGQFDDALADIEDPATITEPMTETTTSTTTNPDGTTTTTTTTTTTSHNPVTGQTSTTSTSTQETYDPATQTTTTTETTTQTEEDSLVLPDIPDFPLIPPFDTTIDVPEKEPIPIQAWRDMIPFMDVLEGTKVEATGGVCLLTITTNQFGSWDLDFCSWDAHLQWLGNFIYIFACFIGLRMVLTGRE